MRIRNLLLSFVLAMMVMCVGSFTTNSIKAQDSCQTCVDVYNGCAALCNGNAVCLKQCKKDYNECLCGCGFDTPGCQ
jgi:hypothetical protein